MTSQHPRPDIPSRLLALIVFLLGIGLLCAVFSLAWSLFQSPVPGLNLPVKPGTATPPAANIGAALTAFVRQLLLLAMMIIAGSVIAGKGIHLYFGTTHGNPPHHREEPQTADKQPGKEPADAEATD